MPGERNFLLGYGERLTDAIKLPRGGGAGNPPYSFEDARDRLAPMLQAAARNINALPAAACPDNYAVAVLTLHPEYTAKSYHPTELLRAVGLEAIGSRSAKVKPEKWKKKKELEEAPTTELFVAGNRKELSSWARTLPTWTDQNTGANKLFEIERIQAPVPSERIRPMQSKSKEPLLEIVLHTNGLPKPLRILEQFEAYAKSFGLNPDFDRRFETGGLCFFPLRARLDVLTDLAKFTFLRVLREMPALRPIDTVLRSAKRKKSLVSELPLESPVDPHLKIAVFDGGLPDTSPMPPYLQHHEPEGIGKAVPEGLVHGLAVSSALLFGSIEDGQPLPRPYAKVDHYRVLDENSMNDPNELYDVLARIQSTLQSHAYPFANLCIGPSLPIEDDEVHAWTSVLDEVLADGRTLAAVAVGNTGQLDRESGNARIQVPSDSVNALAVGAADTLGKRWKRAPYSSIGPGRSPGLVKPDVLAFGGTQDNPFWVLDDSLQHSIPKLGTSFATPLALRMASGIRAHFGEVFLPLTLKSLLIHAAEDADLERDEIGWGRIPHVVDDYVLCPSGSARVVYQGVLSPSQTLRAQIPLPAETLTGKVQIRATFCFSSKTDPQDPGNYTRGGLDITFRPDSRRIEAGKIHPKTSPFFRKTDFDPESDLRHNAQKWETTLHNQKTMLGKSLNNPVFDIHYQTRIGNQAQSGDPVRYSLVVTVVSPKTENLYDLIVNRYRTQLEPLRPIIEIPIQL